MAYTIRSTSNDISHLVPTDLTLEQAQKCARNQIKADAMSYGLNVGRDARIETIYDDNSEAVAYVLIRNYNHTDRGHIASQELGRVTIVVTD